MSKNRGLGRGFDALIPTEVTEDMPAAMQPAKRDEVHQLTPGAIKPNPHQPRTDFDQDELQGLADSIKQHGILQPLVVSDKGSGQYELIAGERRLRASKLAGLEKVPAIIRSFDEQQKLELALIENVQRAELNPIETAVAYRKLMDEFNLSLDEVSERMGKAKSTVSNIVRLLQLPAAAQSAISKGVISEAHGRAILSVSDPAKQEELLQLIQTNGWTVRQAEEFARAYKAPTGTKEAAHARIAKENPLTKELGDYLGTKVSMQPSAKGGRLVIEYYSDEELQRIFETIKKD